MGGFGAKIGAKVKTDPNFPRLGKGIVLGIGGLRAGAKKYFIDKIPLSQWITVYSPLWIAEDALAGSSVGMLLIPQALIYSTLAGVPIQQALLASWLPGLIYAFMGTARDISIGPTATSAVFTATIVKSLGEMEIPPSVAVSVVSFSLGLWSMIFGLLKLGFLFDFVSIPMSLAFAMGSAIVVVTLQIPVILGLEGIPNNFMVIMPQVLAKIKETKPLTFAVAISSILFLVAFTIVGNKWGKNNKIIGLLAASRTVHVIGIFTGISYFVNNGLEVPKWTVLGPVNTAISSPTGPNGQLLPGLILPILALMFTTALEHVAMAKAFAQQNGYAIDASQEVFTVGVVNMVNSLFGGLPVGGGDIARAAVNATSGVKSPLAGVFSSITVLLGMYAMGGTLAFMPSATVAAVIAVSVVDKQPPQALIGKYWKISFVDFLAFLMAFNMTFSASGTIGIGISFAFLTTYTLMRFMFSRPAALVSIDLETQYSSDTPLWWAKEDRIPVGTQVIKLKTDAIWLNTERLKRHILDTVYTYQSGNSNKLASTERAWNYRLDKHIAKLRQKAGISDADTFLPRLRVVIIDLTSTSFIDVCAVHIFEEIKVALRTYAGDEVEFRFVGMNQNVKRRFVRAGWKIVSPHDKTEDATIGLAVGTDDTKELKPQEEEMVKDLWFEFLPHAIQYVSPTGPEGYNFEQMDLGRKI